MNELIEQTQELYEDSKNTEERLTFIDQQIQELQTFKYNLDKIKHNNEQEMLAALGKGVFVRSQMKEDRFFVDVGAGVLVKKDSAQVISIIDQQIMKLGEMRQQTAAYFMELHRQLETLLDKINNKEKDI